MNVEWWWQMKKEKQYENKFMNLLLWIFIIILMPFQLFFCSSQFSWMKLKCVHVSIKWLYKGKIEKTSAINHQQFILLFFFIHRVQEFEFYRSLIFFHHKNQLARKLFHIIQIFIHIIIMLMLISTGIEFEYSYPKLFFNIFQIFSKHSSNYDVLL